MTQSGVVIIAFALLLQASTPVPRQGAQGHAAQTNKEKRNGASNQAPAGATPTDNPQSTLAPKDDNQNKAAEGKQQDISVRIARLEDGQINVKKDIADYIYIGATLAVALTSLFLAMAAKTQAKAAQSQARSSESAAKSAADNAEAANANARAVEAQNTTLKETLAAIQRQADNMDRQTGILKESVEAAKQSTEIVISKERARLFVKPEPLEFRPRIVGPQITYKVIFYGYTEAFITESGASWYLSNSKEPDLSWFTAPTGIGEIITPKTPETTCYVFDPQLTAAEWDEINKRQRFAHFRGFINYKDVFERDRQTISIFCGT